MYLKKYILRRQHQVCILQGMCHEGPPELYERIQRELDEKISEGFIILYENFRYPTEPESHRPQDFNQILSDWRVAIARLADEYTRLAGQVTQKDQIIYSSNALSADIDYGQFTRAVIAQDLLAYFETYTRRIDWLIWCLHKEHQHFGSLKMTTVLLDSFAASFFNKTWSVIIDLRDQAAHEIIEHTAGWHDRFMVHYGDNHIKGIANHLKSTGWQLIEALDIEVPASPR